MLQTLVYLPIQPTTQADSNMKLVNDVDDIAIHSTAHIEACDEISEDFEEKKHLQNIIGNDLTPSVNTVSVQSVLAIGRLLYAVLSIAVSLFVVVAFTKSEVTMFTTF